MSRTALVSLAGLGVLLAPWSAHARVITADDDPALAQGTAHELTGVEDATPSSAAFVIGETLVTIESSGLSGDVLQCFDGDCQMVAYMDDPVTLTFDPPVAAVGLEMSYSVGPFNVTVDGSAGNEMFDDVDVGWEHPSDAFFGAADIGMIETVVIEAGDYATYFDSIVIAEDAVAGDGPDVRLAGSGVTEAGPGATVTLEFTATNDGPGLATDVEVSALLPPGATADEATVVFGDLSEGGSADVPVAMRTPDAFWCEDVLRTIGVVRHGGDADPTNNIAVVPTLFDQSAAAGREDCSSPRDDDCDGLTNCFDPDCADAQLCEIDLNTIARGPFPPPLPWLDLPENEQDPFRNFPDPFELPARMEQCTVTNVHGDEQPRPAMCCGPRPGAGDPNFAEWVSTCPPLDPNFKEADPPVNGAGYGTIAAGETIDYAITYENIGGSDAHDVEIIDVLDLDLDIDTLSIEDGGTFDPDTRTLRWYDPVLPPHTPRTVHFTIDLRADAPLGTRVRNVATIVFPDAFPPTRIDTPLVEHVIPVPDQEPTLPDLFVIGCDEIDSAEGTYTVRLGNHGLGFAYNATAQIIDAPDDFDVQDDACAFAHPTDPNPETLSTVIPWAFTESTDVVAFTAPAEVEDPCAELTWAIDYTLIDGTPVHTEGKGNGQGDGPGTDTGDTDTDTDGGVDSDSDSGGAGTGGGDSGCGCRQAPAAPPMLLAMILFGFAAHRRRR